MSKKTIIRENPVISVIGLSRFVTSESNKKETILRKLKFSEPPLFTRYANPKNALNTYLKDKNRDTAVFEEYTQKEKERMVDSDFKKSDQKCCMECLEILKSKSPILFKCYDGRFSKRGLKKQFTHIYTYGVDVSLSPDLTLYDEETNNLAGFVKLSFSKQKRQRLTYQQGQLIAGLIKEHLEDQFQVELDRKLCMAFDVFAEKIIIAPETMTWVKDKPKLDIACNEISLSWPHIQENANK